MFFLMVLWNLSFYLEKRKELRVAKKIIRMYATQGKVVPHLNGECKRLDEVLLKAIWELKIGEEVASVINGLQKETRRGEALPEGGARLHYVTAIDHLTDAVGRDRVLAWEERERDLIESEKMLWATRAENMRYLVQDLLTSN